jgi:hypothetical protein
MKILYESKNILYTILSSLPFILIIAISISLLLNEPLKGVSLIILVLPLVFFSIGFQEIVSTPLMIIEEPDGITVKFHFQKSVFIPYSDMIKFRGYLYDFRGKIYIIQIKTRKAAYTFKFEMDRKDRFDYFIQLLKNHNNIEEIKTNPLTQSVRYMFRRWWKDQA